MFERILELFERLVVAAETIAANPFPVNIECADPVVEKEGSKLPLFQTPEDSGFPESAEMVLPTITDGPLPTINYTDLSNKKIVSLCEERGIPTTSEKTGRLRGYTTLRTALRKWDDEYGAQQQESPFPDDGVPPRAETPPEPDPVQDLEPSSVDPFAEPISEVEIIHPPAEVVSAEKLLQKGIEAYHIAEKNLPGSGNELIAKYCQQYSGQPGLKSVTEEHRNAVYNALCAIRPAGGPQ